MCRLFFCFLFVAAILWGSLPLLAIPAGAAPPDTAIQKALAGRPIDTAVLRHMPQSQVGGVAAWKTKLQDYYTIVKNSQNAYLEFCAALLVRSGLPQELKLICLIESHMNPDALSEDGALGIWQLMPAVALEAGLAATPFDERRDIYKSSQVAVRLILALYKKFEDPLLVVAAYNCGGGRVSKELTNAGATRYWAIHNRLPAETQNHVFKYLAALSIFYNLPLPVAVRATQSVFVQPIAATPTFSNPVENKKDGLLTIQITASYKPGAIQKYTGILPADFAQHNPDMTTILSQQGIYNLRLPAAAMQLFLLHKPQILRASILE